MALFVKPRFAWRLFVFRQVHLTCALCHPAAVVEPQGLPEAPYGRTQGIVQGDHAGYLTPVLGISLEDLK